MRLEAAKMAIPGGGVCSIDTQHLNMSFICLRNAPIFALNMLYDNLYI